MRRIIISIFWLFIISDVLLNKDLNKATFSLGFNPLALINKQAHFQIGCIIDYKHEIVLPIIPNYKNDDLTYSNYGIEYRYHRSKDIRGKLIGLGLNVSRVDWAYENETEMITKTILYPYIIYGYRIIIGENFGFVTKMIGDYKIGDLKAKDGTERLDRPNSNYKLSFGFELEYFF